MQHTPATGARVGCWRSWRHLQVCRWQLECMGWACSITFCSHFKAWRACMVLLLLPAPHPGLISTLLSSSCHAAAAGSPAPGPPLRSPITTHVLDTCMGRPAPGVKATLARLAPGSAAAWQPLAAGQTDKDGRIGNLLAPSGTVEPGHYKMTWDTAEYMHRCSRQFPDFFPPGRRFYPSVSVEFEIHAGQVGDDVGARLWVLVWVCTRARCMGLSVLTAVLLPRHEFAMRQHCTVLCRTVQEREHFHVPLTWNPFGYSTYRGS